MFPGPVARVLEYVLLLFLFSLPSTLVGWLAATIARTEHRRLRVALVGVPRARRAFPGFRRLVAALPENPTRA